MMQGYEKIVRVLVVVLLGRVGAVIYFFADRSGGRGRKRKLISAKPEVVRGNV